MDCSRSEKKSKTNQLWMLFQRCLGNDVFSEFNIHPSLLNTLLYNIHKILGELSNIKIWNQEKQPIEMVRLELVVMRLICWGKHVLDLWKIKFFLRDGYGMYLKWYKYLTTINCSLSINKSFRLVDHSEGSYSSLLEWPSTAFKYPQFAHFKIWLNKVQETIFTIVDRAKHSFYFIL